MRDYKSSLIGLNVPNEKIGEFYNKGDTKCEVHLVIQIQNERRLLCGLRENCINQLVIVVIERKICVLKIIRQNRR